MTDRQNWIRYRASSEGVEWAEAFFSERAFSPHRHDTYAIGYTTKGVQTFGYRGEVRHSRPGNVFVLHPDELHDGRPGTDEGYGYRIFYIAPDLIGDAVDTQSLPFVAEAVSSDPRLKAAVIDTFPHRDETEDGLHRVDAITRLAEALCEVSGACRKRPHPKNRARMQRIRGHLLETAATDRFSLSALEHEHGMDRFSLARQFRYAFGVGPYRFVILRRLDLVKGRIRSGESLAEAALAGGFADQSHMTRHFRNAFGLSPGAWRNLLV